MSWLPVDLSHSSVPLLGDLGCFRVLQPIRSSSELLRGEPTWVERGLMRIEVSGIRLDVADWAGLQGV